MSDLVTIAGWAPDDTDDLQAAVEECQRLRGKWLTANEGWMFDGSPGQIGANTTKSTASSVNGDLLLDLGLKSYVFCELHFNTSFRLERRP